MAKVKRQINWTLRAINDKLAIMDYWLEKNKSLDYPLKLEQLFNKSLELLSGYPESGQIFSIAPPIFFKIVRGYRIYNVFDS